MKKLKFILSLVIASMLLIAQAGVVFAAPVMKDVFPIIGNVQKITVESDPTTGLTTVLVKFKDENGGHQTVRLSNEIAKDLGLITLDGDGNPVINKAALGQNIDIDLDAVILIDEKHPVGSALTDFFSDDVEGLDYPMIMDMHANGNGFGVIAQALWIIKKLGGDADDFVLLLDAKKNKDYTEFFVSFPLEDGTIPTTWGQVKKAVSENLVTVMSHKDKEVTNNNDNGNNGNEKSNPDKANNKDKDKNQPNKGNSNENGNSNKP